MIFNDLIFHFSTKNFMKLVYCDHFASFNRYDEMRLTTENTCVASSTVALHMNGCTRPQLRVFVGIRIAVCSQLVAVGV